MNEVIVVKENVVAQLVSCPNCGWSFVLPVLAEETAPKEWKGISTLTCYGKFYVKCAKCSETLLHPYVIKALCQRNKLQSWKKYKEESKIWLKSLKALGDEIRAISEEHGIPIPDYNVKGLKAINEMIGSLRRELRELRNLQEEKKTVTGE